MRYEGWKWTKEESTIERLGEGRRGVDGGRHRREAFIARQIRGAGRDPGQPLSYHMTSRLTLTDIHVVLPTACRKYKTQSERPIFDLENSLQSRC